MIRSITLIAATLALPALTACGKPIDPRDHGGDGEHDAPAVERQTVGDTLSDIVGGTVEDRTSDD